MLFRSALRTASLARYAARPLLVARPVAPLRTFTASVFPRMSHGSVDRDLETKLSEELAYEKENVPTTETPEFLKELQEAGVWKIEDKSGEKEVALTRQFGNEKITLLFSTDALVEAQEELDEEQPEQDESLPVNLSVIIQKQDAGALDISVTAQEGSFFIESVAYSPSSSLVVDTSAEGDWQRRGRFGGPVFADLDENLQDLFHSYLEERGLDAKLATFIPQYVEHKEQVEYTSWLSQVAKFIKK
ncbi:mitochondrial glycoprotein [Phlyctochytrium arcticum]|nr:mitochondrial glycoprotein [Phlyctochytrium arcticum]